MGFATKRPGEGHHTVDFGGGTTSRRGILPGKDIVNVKTSHFRPKAGWTHTNPTGYDTDETVLVLEGEFELKIENQVMRVKAGGEYHIQAGTPFECRALTDCYLWCVWSPAPGGPNPNDE